MTGRRRTRILGAAAIAAVTAAAGCTPTLDDHPWLISRLTIVGWKADPPEVAPGSSVTLQALALDPTAAADPAATAWTLCRTPKAPADNRVVAPDCLTPAASPDAIGDPVSIRIPDDVCMVFGPDVPQPLPGQPATRSRDPDATGGYFQPVTIALDGALAIGLERITCDLPDASLADARAFLAAYTANQDPSIAGLTFSADDGTPIDPGAIAPGAHIAIQATWLAGAVETFFVFDRRSRTILATAETLQASWYVTGGALDRPAATITDTSAVSTTTGWTAPAGTATVRLALVLRDSRGGSDIARATLVVAGP